MRGGRTGWPAVGWLVAVVALLVAGCGTGNRTARSGPAATARCTASVDTGPTCGAWLGIWPRTTADGTMTTDLRGNLASMEHKLGRRLDIVSRYYGWGQLPADRTDRVWRDQGHLVLMDLRARDFDTGRYASWRSIAAGRYDGYLRRVADRLTGFGAPVLFSFNQEPEQELEQGTGVAGSAAEFAAAYRHVHDVITGAGARNVRWVWWVMGYLGHTDWYRTLYPGDRYVDWLSYDPYDFNTCHGAGYRPAGASVLPFLRWLDRNRLGTGKPVLLSEFGSNGDRRGDWYRQLGDVVKNTPRIRAIVEFDSSVAGCDTRITASADNWAGYQALADDPYFRQPVPVR